MSYVVSKYNNSVIRNLTELKVMPLFTDTNYDSTGGSRNHAEAFLDVPAAFVHTEYPTRRRCRNQS